MGMAPLTGLRVSNYPCFNGISAARDGGRHHHRREKKMDTAQVRAAMLGVMSRLIAEGHDDWTEGLVRDLTAYRLGLDMIDEEDAYPDDFDAAFDAVWIEG